MNQTLSIRLITALALITGLIDLCWSTLIFTGTLWGPVSGTMAMIAGFLYIVGPILRLIFAYGAYKLRSWAWYLGLVASVFAFIGVIIYIIDGSPIWFAFCGSVWSVIIFIYLLTPHGRMVFGRGAEQPSAPEGQP
jgi:multisubunit Na+/H+ antiporter MnhG subunit